MKKFNLLLIVSALLLFNSNVNAEGWQDILEQVVNLTKKTKTLPTTTRTKSSSTVKDKLKDLSLEHAQRLAEKASIRAVEDVNQSVSAVQNIGLHLNNVQQIKIAADHLKNVISGKGNTLQEAEKAKEMLHAILSEAKMLEKNARAAVLFIERTTRVTDKLNKRLQATNGVLNPYSELISKFLDTLKNQPLSIPNI